MASLHLLPRAGHQNGTRRTSSRGGCCYPKGFAPFQNGEENFVRTYLLPGTDKQVGFHLLPIADHPNDTRRISSPGGCCAFGGGLPSGNGRSDHESSAPLARKPRGVHSLIGMMSGAPPMGAYQESTTHLTPAGSLITAVACG